MNITRISLRNFRSWPELELDVERGVTLLSGPNGAGKSSLIEACLFAMYGASSDAGALIRRGTDQARAEIRVDTEHGVLWIAREIRRSGTGAKVSLSLAREVGGDLEVLTAATVTETQALLDRLLGVSREVLAASAFSTQHGGAAFTEAAPRDRKRVFAEILALGFWDVLADRARVELKAAQSAATLARAQVEQLDGAGERLAEANARMTESFWQRDAAAEAELNAETESERLAAEAEAAREARRQHAAAVEAAERARADHERATAERAAADEALQRARDAAANAPSVETAIVALEAAMDALGEAQEQHEFASEAARKHAEQLAEARRGLASAAQAREFAETEESSLRARYAAASANACPECGQELVTPDAQAIVGRLAEQHTAAGLGVESAADAVETWDARTGYLAANAPLAPDDDVLRAARTAAQQAQTRLAEAETIQSLAGSISAAEDRARAAAERENETTEALRVANAALDDPRFASSNFDVEAAYQGALTAVAEARQAHSTAAAELARAEEAAKTAEREATAESLARDTLATVEQEAAIAGILAAGFGPQGVPAMIVDGVLGDLADEANRVLAELGSPIRVDLRSQKLLKSSDRLADTLDIIAIMDGMEAPYETLSGGERTRLALALRAALTRLLASKRGARVRLLVVDEPAGLDATGCEQLASVLEEFVTAGVFETVILVTHQTELAEQIARVIRIEKTPGGESRLVENRGPLTPGAIEPAPAGNRAGAVETSAAAAPGNGPPAREAIDA